MSPTLPPPSSPLPTSAALSHSPSHPSHNVSTSPPPTTTATDADDLRRVVDDQRREIALLRQQLSALTTVPHQPSSDPSHLPSASEHRPVDLISGLVSDHLIGLAFPALLRGLTTKQDVSAVAQLCQTIVGDDPSVWHPLFKAFYTQVIAARARLPPHVLAMEQQLSPDWFREPWYLAYVQKTGVELHPDDPHRVLVADFDSFRRTLPYIRHSLGFRNLCILPHYESPMADGGYDVSAFEVRTALGGQPAFERFMADAATLGMRVATDAVFNHVSTEHIWFQRAISGDARYLRYFVQRNGREKIAEYDRDGDIVCQYRDPDGTITERVVVFPEVDRTHGLWVEINGQTYQFYRSFFPFQVDLNLQNPDVLEELFQILADDLCAGVMGKRMDAIAHWVKKPGSASDGLSESHAVQALLKSFLRHVHCRAIVMPEVVRDLGTAATYAGSNTSVNGVRGAEEGDAILSFEMQAALRETTYFQTIAPFWRRVFQSDELIDCATWVNALEHHDEQFLGFFPREMRRWISEYIKLRGGTVFKNGMSAGGRYANCLDGNVQRLATAIFLLYLAPGTPMVYAGLEVAARNAWIHARDHAKGAKETFAKLGVFVDETACFDARELHRGTLAREMLEEKAEEDFEAIRLIRKLNQLRENTMWMTATLQPVDSGDVGVLCAVRREEGKRMLCVANLTPMRKNVCVPARQAEMVLGVGAWVEERAVKRVVEVLLEGKVEVRCDATNLKFDIAAFGRAILDMC